MSIFIKTLEYEASKLSQQNLRDESNEWKNEEVRKVNEIFGIFGEEYTFKTN